MNNYILVKYCEDYGRMGVLEGVFVTTQETLNLIKGKYIVYGEVLGRHSEIFSDESFCHCEVVAITNDECYVIERLFHNEWYYDCLTLSGINPVTTYLERSADE